MSADAWAGFWKAKVGQPRSLQMWFHHPGLASLQRTASWIDLSHLAGQGTMATVDAGSPVYLNVYSPKQGRKKIPPHFVFSFQRLFSFIEGKTTMKSENAFFEIRFEGLVVAFGGRQSSSRKNTRNANAIWKPLKGTQWSFCFQESQIQGYGDMTHYFSRHVVIKRLHGPAIGTVLEDVSAACVCALTSVVTQSEEPAFLP